MNNEYYVINNISIDFYINEQTEPYGSSWGIDKENDRIGYYMTAEVSMSKKVATKSLITNPNTNIRDYGIPQNRERVFVVSILKEHDTNGFTFPEPFKLETRLKDLLEDEVPESYYLEQKTIDKIVNSKFFILNSI